MNNIVNDSNKSRMLIKIIKEIANESGMEFRSYSYDWIIQLTKNGRSMFIYGYQFPSNDAAAQLICSDKAALAYVLSANGVPCIEHEYFMSADNLHYTGKDGNWDRMKSLLEKWRKVVVKKNNGSGGNGVFLVHNQSELESCTAEIFKTSRSLAISPYCEIENEYRVIYSYGKVMLVYSKQRPFVICDGKTPLYQLIAEKFGAFPENSDELDLFCVPKNGEKVNVNWKHNLGQGASPIELNADDAMYGKVVSVALSAAKAVNVNFASVDVVDCNGELKILEINSGIMMESFARCSTENYAKAKDIYKSAIENCTK